MGLLQAYTNFSSRIPSCNLSDPNTRSSDAAAGKLLNMSDKNLSDTTEAMLCKGPNFALSRTINRHVIRDVEIGLERGAFALRWRKDIDERAQQHQRRPSSKQN